ncbi:MAG: hypothetical protein WCQ21_33105 [Verrucomicrobiota bacterium]
MKHDMRELPLVPRRVGGAEAISALIARYRRSGLSLAEFARAERLPLGRLHYWLYQKHRPGVAAHSFRGGCPAATPAFREVRLASGLDLVTSWAAEVSLPAGLAVRFSATAAPAWVGAVVQALQRPC